MVAQVRQMVNGGVVTALILSAVSPSLAASPQLQKKRVDPASIASFTPAAADPRAAASFTRGGLSQSGFRFTPSVALGARRAVTVAVRARPTRANVDRVAMAAPVSAIAPSAYNLGVAIGWKQFALSGDVARIDTGLLPGGRESADLALSYSDRRWSTRLQLGAERNLGETVRVAGLERGYSLDLGGSYALTKRLEVTGGVRYRMQRDGLDRLADERRDSQAVYIGTAFRF